MKLTGVSACCLRGIVLACLLSCVGPAVALPYVPLEGLSDARWQNFERRLADLQAGRANRPLSILQLGDSHTAGQYLSGRIRQRFQSLFGNAGPGILPPGPVKDHPVFQVRTLPSPQWITTRDRRAPGKSSTAPLPGLGGVVGYGNTPYQSVMYELPGNAEASRVYVYSGGASDQLSRFRLYQDGVELPPLSSRGALEDGRAAFDLPSGSGRLTLLARGTGDEVRFFGLTGMSRRPGVVFSSIGVNGARFGILQEWDGEVTHAQLKDYAPSLLILAFGTNDVVDPDFSREQFAEALHRTADWLRRNAPDSAVLLILPPQAPAFRERASQNLDTARNLMRQLAADNRWRVWDWSALVSRNCYVSCFNTDSGPAFQPDGIHLTRKGYELTADVLFEAIVSGSR